MAANARGSVAMGACGQPSGSKGHGYTPDLQHLYIMQARYEASFGKFFRVEQLILSTTPAFGASDARGEDGGGSGSESGSGDESGTQSARRAPSIVADEAIKARRSARRRG